MCMGIFLHACICVMCTPGVWGGEEASCELPCVCWELNPDTLQVHQVFLTTAPSLQPLEYKFYVHESLQKWAFGKCTTLLCLGLTKKWTFRELWLDKGKQNLNGVARGFNRASSLGPKIFRIKDVLFLWVRGRQLPSEVYDYFRGKEWRKRVISLLLWVSANIRVPYCFEQHVFNPSITKLLEGFQLRRLWLRELLAS